MADERNDEFQDRILKCQDCENEFIFYRGEQIFFQQREEEMRAKDPTAKFEPPKRCKICRRKHKAERQRILSVQQSEKVRLEEAKPQMEGWKQQLAGTAQTVQRAVTQTTQVATT